MTHAVLPPVDAPDRHGSTSINTRHPRHRSPARRRMPRVKGTALHRADKTKTGNDLISLPRFACTAIDSIQYGPMGGNDDTTPILSYSMVENDPVLLAWKPVRTNSIVSVVPSTASAGPGLSISQSSIMIHDHLARPPSILVCPAWHNPPPTGQHSATRTARPNLRGEPGNVGAKGGNHNLASRPCPSGRANEIDWFEWSRQRVVTTTTHRPNKQVNRVDQLNCCTDSRSS